MLFWSSLTFLPQDASASPLVLSVKHSFFSASPALHGTIGVSCSWTPPDHGCIYIGNLPMALLVFQAN